MNRLPKNNMPLPWHLISTENSCVNFHHKCPFIWWISGAKNNINVPYYTIIKLVWKKVPSKHVLQSYFSSFCGNHRPRQMLKVDVKKAIDRMCSICKTRVNGGLDSERVLRAPCCKNNLYHRICIQVWAHQLPQTLLLNI